MATAGSSEMFVRMAQARRPRSNLVQTEDGPERALRCGAMRNCSIPCRRGACRMHLHLNNAREHWTLEGENPPVVRILCAERDHAVPHHALDGLPQRWWPLWRRS